MTGKSLTFYRKECEPKFALRYSLENLKNDDGLLNIPLFLADLTHRFIKSM